MSNIVIHTPRFKLRTLEPADATPRYSWWMEQTSVAQHISAARYSHTVSDLKKYIEQRIPRNDVLFLGIFILETGEHIGNIKYEPVDIVGKYAVMGIMIGEPEWRGRGVASEVIQKSALWLSENMRIKEIVLGVARDNAPAIKVYEKVGFREESTDKITINPETGMSMIWHL
jgi:ribosomal-protein-alanine N-acetyltransferase